MGFFKFYHNYWTFQKNIRYSYCPSSFQLIQSLTQNLEFCISLVLSCQLSHTLFLHLFRTLDLQLEERLHTDYIFFHENVNGSKQL